MSTNGAHGADLERTPAERVERLRAIIGDQAALAAAILALSEAGHIAEAHALAGWVGKIDAEALLLDRALRRAPDDREGAFCELAAEHRGGDAAMTPDPLDSAAVEAATDAAFPPLKRDSRDARRNAEARVRAAVTAYLDRSGLAEAESEIKAMFAETEQRLIAKVDALVAERDEARASMERERAVVRQRDAVVKQTEQALDEAVARAEAAERERAIERTSVDQLLAELAEARSAVARLEAENAELRAERQAVIDAVNLYGDETLHRALDDIGWPHD